MTEQTKNYFQILNAIDVSEKVEKKKEFSYLSWVYAWSELKKAYPDATYKVFETETGCIYWTDGQTAWVKTGVTVNETQHIEYLPVMDFANKSITLEKLTAFDVNKAIQRSITKAIARHGLGLFIYAGEDLPDAGKKKSGAANKKKYDEYMSYLDTIDTKERWLGVKPKKDEWVSWVEDNYSEEYSDQLNDKFLKLANKYEPPIDDIPF